MSRSPRFYGYLYFLIASIFVYFAIQQNNRTEGWDIFTIILMAVAAIDYMIAFRYFALAGKKDNDKKE
ncbi:YdiK family protein [Evansella tamaricis]|uniref:YdiK family protein n=1 Tax=Evansella tamaricis TaxID=2069301 RepID=A0ABS6JJG7_9BACI|nr:YdiK family protein [Evansella tamaricis]MBU9713535.1 YdiK family protein [Evansella tamaricis]